MKFYERIYSELTTKCQSRGLDKSKLEGYYECHHIIPRSLGGSDLPENLVLLTAREHFIAHWLLTKFTVGDDRRKMLHALHMMNLISDNQGRKLTARQYEICRKAKSEAIRIQVKSGTYCSQTTEFRHAQSERISARNKANVESGTHPFQTFEAKQATSERMLVVSKAKVESGTHNFQSPEHKQATAERMKLKFTCEHCGKSVNVGQLGKNHGDKCKLLTEIGTHCLLRDKPTKWKSCPVDGCDYGCCNSVGGMTKHMKKHHS